MKFRSQTNATITAIVAVFSMVVCFYTPVVAAEDTPELTIVHKKTRLKETGKKP